MSRQGLVEMAEPTYLPNSSSPDTLSDSELEVLSEEGSPAAISVKDQEMFVWNSQYKKWHECNLSLCPPYLTITEHEDTRVEVSEKQLLHLQERWFHGNLGRRDAKHLLQDYGAGDGSFLVRTSESYQGKFAISFMLNSKVKHVVIETQPDPVTGVIYHITPNGPYFDSLYSLIEEAKKTKVIHNHLFDLLLTKSPPKPNHGWLHGVKSLSEADEMIKKQPDGSFFVYKTSSIYAPYSLVYKSNGSIRHAPIMVSHQPSNSFNLNGITAPVLYKLVHYFMENPIHGDSVLQYPVLEEQKSHPKNFAMAVEDTVGDPVKNEMSFSAGSIITNITRKSQEWSVGDHRGYKHKFFPIKAVRFLNKEEMEYVLTTKASYLAYRDNEKSDLVKPTPHIVNMKTDYTVKVANDDANTLTIQPSNPLITSFRDFTISCLSKSDMEQWYHLLKMSSCLPDAKDLTSKKGSKRKRKPTCVIS